MLRPDGVLLDLDGTVYEHDRPIAGATETVAALRAAGIGVRFATNTTRMPRRALVERLGGMGIAAEVADVLTAPAAAAAWLAREHVTRIALYVAEETREDFADFQLDGAKPEAVVLGDLGANWTFDILNRAFRQVLGGARLVALQRNRYWKTADGLSLDAGPFVAALEYATHASATVVGKPAPEFFRAAAASLHLPADRIVVVGDDVTTDIAGGQGIGMQGVLVRSGKHRAGDESSISPPPAAVIYSIAALPKLLGI
jgi:HAD superfamily hydrolase (TIGR01458 family)